jgi:penicillin-binding protein 1A
MVGMMNAMMRETLTFGTGRKAEIGYPAAGKTGTSQDFRDAWFVGYTGHLVTGVWLGNDDNSPTRKTTGGGLPVEVWTRFMRVAHQNVPVVDLLIDRGGFFSRAFGGNNAASNAQPATTQPSGGQIAQPPQPLPVNAPQQPAAMIPQPRTQGAAQPNGNGRLEPMGGIDSFMSKIFGR